MIVRLLASCVVASLFASSLMAQDTNNDLAKLQGKWNPTALEVKGKEMFSVPAVTYTIAGSEYTSWKSDDQKVGIKVAFKIDASKTPKTIDLTLKDGKVFLGIYKLEGDTLTICRETGSGVRPADFKTTNTEGSLSVWKRIVF